MKVRNNRCIYVPRPAFTLPISNSFGKLEMLANELETVVIGDSIVRYQNYEFAKRNEPKRKVICKPGANIDSLTNIVNSTNLQNRSSLVICHVGTNNLKNTRSEAILDKYHRLIQTLKTKTEHVIISGLLPRPHDDERIYSKIIYINTALRNICSRESVSYFDGFSGFIDQDDMFMSDGIHLNDLGNARFGRMLHSRTTAYYKSIVSQHLNEQSRPTIGVA